MLRQLEDQLQIILNAESSTEKRAELSALFWKSQFLELYVRYNSMSREFEHLKDTSLLPDEIDDGK